MAPETVTVRLNLNDSPIMRARIVDEEGHYTVEITDGAVELEVVARQIPYEETAKLLKDSCGDYMDVAMLHLTRVSIVNALSKCIR